MSEHTDAAQLSIENVLPLLVLEGAVVFPHTVISITLDDGNLHAAEAALKGDRQLLLAVKRPDADESAELAAQLFPIAVIGRIEQSGVLPGGASGIIVRGLVRAELQDQVASEPAPAFRFVHRPDVVELTPALDQLMVEVRAVIDAVLALRPGMTQEIRNFVRSIEDPGQLADNTGYSPDYTLEERLDLLATFDLTARLIKVREAYRQQLALLEVQHRLRQEVQDSSTRQQREFYLRQQLRAIQKELGEDDVEATELDDLREKLAAVQLPETARKEADRELSRLSRINGSSPEYQMVRTYLEWLAELPWGVYTGKPIDMAFAREVLDADHYGLERIKERLLEYLAVKQRRASLGDDTGRAGREPILAFVGPPGVGKTSLGQSIARALGRTFVRMSLGGVRDEAELRGFRRTYIGSQPGRIIQELRRAGTADPVILLDEIDKIGSDYRGDPAAALLEVLDPEQNYTFTDHYLNLPFDLSKVLFLATANNWDTVPPALRDRMEVIELAGYVESEKLRIAETHLVPRQIQANGLRNEEVLLEEGALRAIINGYTREAGVRNLERNIGGVLRKVVRQITETNHVAPPPVTVDDAFVRRSLGRQRFYNEAQERIDQPGVATGLVWTPVGGDIIFVEAVAVEGNRELKITGQLGDVMRESAEAALTYVRSRAHTLGIDPRFFETHAIHIHVPAGAVPKDGPSAGITIATALASAATGHLVREDIAMTGEIALRGRVLPIGGIKEKALGAHRAGIRTIILPRRNMVELDEMPDEIRAEMTFIPVDTLDEVLSVALRPAERTTLGEILAAPRSEELLPSV
ncbi:endopeptidase La [Candidatus Chloroploca asiatica]|uniref:Lon protease n=1 Tax=Candidatus Chloroploca asiatica TaxID=1506545 RepID=A0A2H3L832_9CHLR|nr:endopeptidase La [Candidatus Chloroploca asiatica]PDW01432.1 endopeptidase La [Candidatus Chloroploca asiatica]